jgi:hypothetical protein
VQSLMRIRPVPAPRPRITSAPTRERSRVPVRRLFSQSVNLDRTHFATEPVGGARGSDPILRRVPQARHDHQGSRRRPRRDDGGGLAQPVSNQQSPIRPVAADLNRPPSIRPAPLACSNRRSRASLVARSALVFHRARQHDVNVELSANKCRPSGRTPGVERLALRATAGTCEISGALQPRHRTLPWEDRGWEVPGPDDVREGGDSKHLGPREHPVFTPAVGGRLLQRIRRSYRW